MDIYKHAAVSFAVSALLQIAFRKIQMSVACFLTGVLIDLDHIFDYYVDHELKKILGYLRHPRKFLKFLSDYYKHKPISKVYKLLHSVELLIPVPLLYAFGIWNDAATGMLMGFVIHLVMDTLPIGHIGSVSIIYKVNKGFPRGAEILKQRLSRIGKDVDRCQICGVLGETVLYRRRYWYAGFTGKGLSKIMILCPHCRDRMQDRRD